MASELHSKELKPVMTAYLEISKKATEENEDVGGSALKSDYKMDTHRSPLVAMISVGFSPTGLSRMGTQVKRNNTIIRSPLDRKDKDKDRSGSGSLIASDVRVPP